MAIRVMVTGALGRMGRHTAATVMAQPDLELVSAVDSESTGQPLSQFVSGTSELTVERDLPPAISRTRPDVMVDFTTPSGAGGNALLAASRGVRPVVGATGIPLADQQAIERECQHQGIGGAIIPNFSIGAMLLEQFAVLATRYLSKCEIIELHHDRKLDAPSGTARRLQERLEQHLTRSVPVHSVRLPSLLAQHQVLFATEGESLTMIHNTSDRTSFMPGVILAIRSVMNRTDFVRSLAELLDR